MKTKQPRAAVLAGLGPAHHRALAVIDLAFFAGRRGDDDARLGRWRPAELRDEASDAGVLGGEAVVVDEVLIDRDRVAAAADGLVNQLAVGLAGARTRRPGVGGQRRWTPPPWKWPVLRAVESVDTSSGIVGFGCASPGRPRPRTGIPAALQVAADGLAVDTRGLLRCAGASSPADRAHRSAAVCCRPRRCSCRRRTTRPSPASTSRPAQLIVGFEVSINCRFWVSTEAESRRDRRGVFHHASLGPRAFRFGAHGGPVWNARAIVSLRLIDT